MFAVPGDKLDIVCMCVAPLMVPMLRTVEHRKEFCSV